MILYFSGGPDYLLDTTNLNVDTSTITTGDEHVLLHTVGGDCLLVRVFLNNDEICLGKACACWVQPGKAISELDLFPLRYKILATCAAHIGATGMEAVACAMAGVMARQVGTVLCVFGV